MDTTRFVTRRSSAQPASKSKIVTNRFRIIPKPSTFSKNVFVSWSAKWRNDHKLREQKAVS